MVTMQWLISKPYNKAAVKAAYDVAYAGAYDAAYAAYRSDAHRAAEYAANRVRWGPTYADTASFYWLENHPFSDLGDVAFNAAYTDDSADPQAYAA